MTRTHARFVGFAATLAALAMTPACSTETPPTAPGTVTVTTTVAAPTGTAPTGAAPTVTQTVTPTAEPTAQPAGNCAVSPQNWPVPHDEPYGFVPKEYRLSVAMSGIASGTVTPGAPPTDVEVTLCNDTPVDYASVGIGLVLDNCSCAPVPGIAKGTVERYDAAAGTWVPVQNPAAGVGMDHLGQFADLGAFPKGRAVTLRYRIALDASMTDGEGGISATAVTADGSLIQIGDARLPFAVTTG
ncbi:hypothetical protein [Mycobacterium sp. NPDC050041]|uniref:hypothetical protein n=1 Tax=Mycobacterium sp. NPDC050041 TaxID=3364293 RepID=UPI003C30A8FA